MGARRAKKPAAGAFCVRTPACRAGGIGEPFSGPAHCATAQAHRHERRPERTAMRGGPGAPAKPPYTPGRVKRIPASCPAASVSRSVPPCAASGGSTSARNAGPRRTSIVCAASERIRAVTCPAGRSHRRSVTSARVRAINTSKGPAAERQRGKANTKMQTRKGNHEKTNTERQPQRRSAPKQNAAKKPAPKGAILLPFGAGMFVYGFGTRQFFSRPFSRYGQHVRKERAEISRTGSPCRRAGRPDGCKRYPARRGTGTR